MNIDFIYTIFDQYKNILKIDSFNEEEIINIIKDDIHFFLNDADDDSFYIIKPDDSLETIESKIKLYINGEGKGCEFDTCAQLILEELCGGLKKYCEIFCSKDAQTYGPNEFYKITLNPNQKYSKEIENKIKDELYLLYCSLLYQEWNTNQMNIFNKDLNLLKNLAINNYKIFYNY
jgi:hypothetical protein